MMTIQEKRNIIEEQTIKYFKWEIDKSQTVSDIKTITLSTEGNYIVFDCHELKKSQEILSDVQYGTFKDERILQICKWIRERVNQRIIDFNLKDFEMIYRWKGSIIFTDKY